MEVLESVHTAQRDCFRTHGGKTLFKRDEKVCTLFVPVVKGWTCSRCGPCKLKRWIKAAESEVNCWQRVVYLSLTMNHKGLEGLPFVDRDKRCIPSWSKFIRIFNKQFPGSKRIMAKEPQPKSAVWS